MRLDKASEALEKPFMTIYEELWDISCLTLDHLSCPIWDEPFGNGRAILLMRQCG
jgi:hypothetical protein